MYCAGFISGVSVFGGLGLGVSGFGVFRAWSFSVWAFRGFSFFNVNAVKVKL